MSNLPKKRNNNPALVWIKQIQDRYFCAQVAEDYDRETLFPTYSSAQCFPAEIILKSLNISHVDFFSLDVEKVEEKVLEHFPFDHITVDVWAIEHWAQYNLPKDLAERYSSGNLYQHKSQHDMVLEGFPREDLELRHHVIRLVEDQSFIAFMVNKGYYYFDSTCTYLGDYVFIRRQSKLFEKLNVPFNQWNRTEVCKFKPLLLKPPYLFNETTFRDRHHYPQFEYKTI